MKTFISDLIPKIQRFSKKLDNLSLLEEKHWVYIGEIGKNKVVYIFRSNKDLLISVDGKVEKAKWDYIGNSSLLIEKKEENYLFKQGFFDENILALKVDGKDEYAFFINENIYDGELNSLDKILDYLTSKYLISSKKWQNQNKGLYEVEEKFDNIETDDYVVTIKTGKGIITIDIPIKDRGYNTYYIAVGQKVFLNGQKAPDGKYNISLMENIVVRDGIIQKVTAF